MSNYDKLKSVLKEVFEIDKADLDNINKQANG
jgi:hypothetical protein